MRLRFENEVIKILDLIYEHTAVFGFDNGPITQQQIHKILMNAYNEGYTEALKESDRWIG